MYIRPLTFLSTMTFAFLMLVSVAASASVVITGTRVIYPSDSREVSVKLSNVGKSPVLIQSWIDTGDIDATPEKIDVPFTITPPINRVDPDKGQTLRIGALPAELPSDQESLFWLNVLEIPAIKQQSVTTENYLKMAFRTRIKMFYRPKGLPESPAQAADSLIWKASGAEVRVENPSPYFVSLVTATANGTTVEADMIAPKSTITLKLRAAPGAKIDASYVNDFGAIVPLSAVLK